MQIFERRTGRAIKVLQLRRIRAVLRLSQAGRNKVFRTLQTARNISFIHPARALEWNGECVDDELTSELEWCRNSMRNEDEWWGGEQEGRGGIRVRWVKCSRSDLERRIGGRTYRRARRRVRWGCGRSDKSCRLGCSGGPALVCGGDSGGGGGGGRVASFPPVAAAPCCSRGG